jgi:hypothetical protein
MGKNKVEAFCLYLVSVCPIMSANFVTLAPKLFIYYSKLRFLGQRKPRLSNFGFWIFQ